MISKKIKKLATMRAGNKPGRLIPKPPIGLFRRKPERYYNYAVDADGNPFAAPMDRVVPCDQYHLRMLSKGDIYEIKDPPAETHKEPAKKKKDDK